MGTPIVEGWFTVGPEPAMIGSRCTTCASTYFPPIAEEGGFCRNPQCAGDAFEQVELSRKGVVWSYTDAQYQPPAPYVAADPYVPFALAAVTLPEGLTVLGQVADGFGVDDIRVGSEVELVVEPMSGLDGDRVVWRWRPTEEVSA
ncbi:MAG: Zn-ribbon domain-containing OB-fold protein [Marmoricola sp.]